MGKLTEMVYRQMVCMFSHCEVGIADFPDVMKRAGDSDVFYAKEVDSDHTGIAISSDVADDLQKKQITRMADAFIHALLSSLQDNEGYGEMQGQYELLLNRLFYSDDSRNTTYTSLLAVTLGVDLSLPRIPCIFQYSSGKSQKRTDVDDHLDSMIRGCLRQQFDGISQNILVSNSTNQVLVCPVLSVKNDSKDTLRALLSKTKSILEKQYKVNVIIGVGEPVTQIPEYRSSYRIAQIALSSCRRNHGDIVFGDECFLEFMITCLPGEILSHFLDGYLNFVGEDMKTIDALVHNTFDLYASAEELHIHRNTLITRIKKIKDGMGLNPLHCDKDRFLLILLSLYDKYPMQKVALPIPR